MEALPGVIYPSITPCTLCEKYAQFVEVLDKEAVSGNFLLTWLAGVQDHRGSLVQLYHLFEERRRRRTVIRWTSDSVCNTEASEILGLRFFLPHPLLFEGVSEFLKDGCMSKKWPWRCRTRSTWESDPSDRKSVSEIRSWNVPWTKIKRQHSCIKTNRFSVSLVFCVLPQDWRDRLYMFWVLICFDNDSKLCKILQ